MKVVVVGLGNQGRKRRAVAGEDVVATVDPCNPEADHRELGAVGAGAYDAALVCTPDKAKLAVIEELVAGGKHVLVEKPLLVGFDDNLRLEALAAETGAICYTAYNHRFEPHLARVKKLLDEGTLGKLYNARLFYGNGTARDVKESVWRDQGMGVVGDLGSHLLDLSLFLFGDRVGDSATACVPWSRTCYENAAPDHAIFSLRGEFEVAMEVSLLSWRNSFKLDITAEKGSIHVDGLCKWGPSEFVVRHRVLPSGKPDEERRAIERDDPTWALEYRHL